MSADASYPASRFYVGQDGAPHLNGATLSFDGTTGNNNISIEDNLADAFNIKEGSTSYLKIVTTNSGEKIVASKKVELADVDLALGTTTGTKIGTATAQKLGFWGATPVVQQVFATGASHTVDELITVLQTLGLVKQS